jgi:hypothetical protein
MIVVYFFLNTRAKSRKITVKAHNGVMKKPKTKVATAMRTKRRVKQPKV